MERTLQTSIHAGAIIFVEMLNHYQCQTHQAKLSVLIKKHKTKPKRKPSMERITYKNE